jgi:HSP20 family molecular chaperone IbpA
MSQNTCVPRVETKNGETQVEQRPTFRPRIEIHTGAEGEVLRAELPGVKRENLELTVEKDVLVLKGTVESGDESREWILREYGVGSFERRFRLGTELDVTALEAKLENGVLTLKLPRKPEARPKRIEITAN